MYHVVDLGGLQVEHHHDRLGAEGKREEEVARSFWEDASEHPAVGHEVRHAAQHKAHVHRKVLPAQWVWVHAWILSVRIDG